MSTGHTSPASPIGCDELALPSIVHNVTDYTEIGAGHCRSRRTVTIYSFIHRHRTLFSRGHHEIHVTCQTYVLRTCRRLKLAMLAWKLYLLLVFETPPQCNPAPSGLGKSSVHKHKECFVRSNILQLRKPLSLLYHALHHRRRLQKDVRPIPSTITPLPSTE